ncbi:hypothetical protein V9K92_02240 [Phyllobacterium sp. CCNWLW109]|uniref:hypothetical protein n=1 Tax=Phyllobacterium sp. CCNWLW109 TaxID=3127479 RepID=UPI0030769CD6
MKERSGSSPYSFAPVAVINGLQAVLWPPYQLRRELGEAPPSYSTAGSGRKFAVLGIRHAAAGV